MHTQQTLLPISKATMPRQVLLTLWFSEWWDIYPLKVSKRQAQATFGKLITCEADYATLLKNTKPWVKVYEARDPNKRPYPATFLNRGTWQDPPPEDLLYASMGVCELLDCGKDPREYGWKMRTAAGGREYYR